MKENMQKSAFVAVVGRPNVGKSSFVNRAVGQKVAIVSAKPQTTRTRIMGVLTEGEDQIVFIDTPGFHRPKTLLGENMIKAVSAGISDVDAAIFVVDAGRDYADGIPSSETELLEQLAAKKLPVLLAINKIDTVKEKEELLPVIGLYTANFNFAAVVPMSVKNNDGVAALINELKVFCKPSPHFFDADTVTDQPERTMVCEMIREKILRKLDKEVPHGIAVDLERFFEKDDAKGEPLLQVSATIYCEKESHKGIVIGKGGAMLKRIGIEARKDIENFFGCRANVELWVKVKEDWRNRQGLIHGFGLDS